LMIASGGTFSIRRRKYWKRTSERNKGPFASGCGTIVVFIMERALRYVDRWRFWSKKERDTNNLFYKQRAMLADFSSRTDISYALGLISPQERLVANVMRGIRNVFAHTLAQIDFSHELIASKW
jgi:hypothetical protein